MRSADWSSVSGSSDTVAAFSLPPPHDGRTSSRSERAMHSSRIGEPRDQSAMCSTRSRNVGSPQWMSSNTSTSGRSRAEASKKPPDRPERVLAGRGLGDAHQLRHVPADELLVLVPVEHRADLRLDDVGEVEVRQARGLLDRLDDREVRDALAVGQAPAAEHLGACRRSVDRNSSTNRDFPTPADPRSVKS